MVRKGSPMRRWQFSMLAFLAFFLIILSGFSPDLGREMSQREEFSYPDSDVWKASDRAEEKMPEEYWLIFQIVMGNSVDSENHNTLKMDVFRETTSRNDLLRADNKTSQYFDSKFNWQVQRDELSTLWGIADTVRAIMNNETVVTKHLKKNEVNILVDLSIGNGVSKVWTCDLTKKYTILGLPVY